MLQPDTIAALLTALGERLALAQTRVELVVIGGSAPTILGLVERPTRDVDVVARSSTAASSDPRNRCRPRWSRRATR